MGTNSLVLRVAADSWIGDPQFTVTVDGQQIGGLYTATASHAAGQWQDITVTGDFAADPSKVDVTFVNDGYGGAGQDRNLYVQSLTVAGQSLSATSVTGQGDSVTNGVAVLMSNGTASFAPPAPTSTLVLRVAADSWNGDPQFTVTVDGKQVGGLYTATASHAAGQWQDIAVTGDFAANPSKVDVTFVNDGYGGAGQDRNLYVQSLTVAGQSLSATSVTGQGDSVTSGVAVLMSNGTASFTPAAPTSTLVLRVAADSWNGDPQFTVTVDGKQVGGLYTATASHAAGQWQDITVTGDFVADPSKVDVTFVNDGYGGAGRDRNLYVQSLTVAGQSLSAATVTGLGDSVTDGVAVLMSNGTASFTPPAPTSTLDLRVAADSWNGDPQFTVTVDGKQVGGIYSASAPHAAGQWQDVVITGAVADPSQVAINFINDGYGGWNADRNLYVQSVSVDGRTISSAGATVTGDANSVSTGVATLLSNGTVTFDTNPPSQPAVDHGLQLLGVNLAGGEFGAANRPGTYGTDYTYPTHAEIDYYASKGMDVIRIPFLWERLQTSLDGPLNTSDLARLDDVVSYATSKGLHTILDNHGYGSGFGQLVGSAGTPDAAFADFWGKMAAHYASNPDVIYGLMNEPNVQSATDWLGAINDGIAAIRHAGASQEVLVSGTHWDGAWTWTSSDNAGVIGSGVVDPLHNDAFEVHQYLDPDGSGTKAGVSSDTIGVDRLTSITDWAESHGAKLFLGEFGVSQDSQSLSAMDKMLTFMGQHADVWQGGTYWAGGPWWWGSNIYGVEPTGLGTADVRDQPQMGILASHLAHGG